jgi:hypothetical protein
MSDCICCRNEGALPGPYIVAADGRLMFQEIDGPVVDQMCDQCVAGTFIPGCIHPHSLDGLRRALADAGYWLPLSPTNP